MFLGENKMFSVPETLSPCNQAASLSGLLSIKPCCQSGNNDSLFFSDCTVCSLSGLDIRSNSKDKRHQHCITKYFCFYCESQRHRSIDTLITLFSSLLWSLFKYDVESCHERRCWRWVCSAASFLGLNVTFTGCLSRLQSPRGATIMSPTTDDNMPRPGCRCCWWLRPLLSNADPTTN